MVDNMMVQELIDKLKKYPPHINVVLYGIANYPFQHGAIDDVELPQTGPVLIKVVSK